MCPLWKMELTKRKIFLLLLGTCGVILLLLANFVDFGSTQEIFLMAANFHNSSLSYLTSWNLNFSVLSENNKRIKSSLVNEHFKSNLDELIRNPKFNVTGATQRDMIKHNNGVSRDSNSVSSGSNSVSRGSNSVSSGSNSVSIDLNRDSVRFNSDSGVKVYTGTKITKGNINDRTNVESLVDNSYMNENTTYVKSKHSVSGNSYNQNRLDNDFNVSNHRESLNQNVSSNITKALTETIHEGEEKLLVSRTGHERQSPQVVEQSIDRTDNVKGGVETDFIHESVMIPNTNSIINEVANNKHDLPHQEEVGVTDKDKRNEALFKTVSEQQMSDLQNGFQTDSHYPEIVKTEAIQNHQSVSGSIPHELFQKYMTNNEQVINDDVIESHAAETSEGNKENRNFNRGGTSSYHDNQQDVNDVLPQNYQHSKENNDLQQRLDNADNRPIGKTFHQSESTRDNYTSNVQEFSVDPSCSRGVTTVEDILCMNRPQFLPDFRNPCWYQRGVLRCLPYFQIIGVCKTGTTDLFERLSHHPQVLKNRGILGKETWYWTWQRYGHNNFYRTYSEKKTLDDFINQFDASTIESHTKRLANGTLYHPAVTGHGDPMDFWDQSSWKRIPQNDYTADVPKFTTPSLIKHVNPDIKLILILRDPIERLFSNYLHGQFGSTADEFHRDVVLSRDLLKACTRNRSMKSCLYDENIIRSLRVPISGSFYSVHIKEWLKVFPRKQIFITRTEAFAKNIADTLLGIFRFLHLDPLPTRDLYRVANMPHFYNTRGKETSGSIRQETRDILRPMFEPYNIELARILKDENFNFNYVR